eukprot:GHVS01018532.1.p1 GENE.GHVS01018532.1~~GHVS01018532.1.p1  ORF type:complete len:370 (+),score=81.46 GHVS01018532.1:187-1296(+)
MATATYKPSVYIFVCSSPSLLLRISSSSSSFSRFPRHHMWCGGLRGVLQTTANSSRHMATTAATTAAGGGDGVADFSCIGVIGLGNMGLPIARNWLSAGHKLIVYDVSGHAVDEAVRAGATRAGSVKDLAMQATSVFSMLPALSHVQSVYFGPEGVLANLRKSNTLIIDASTIGPVGSGEVIEEAKKHGHRMIDAPVSGGVTAAAGATLTFMVGASDKDFKAVEPLLRKVGRAVVHCGGTTKGQAVKVCNNMILGCTMMGVSEGFRLVQSLGVDMKLFNDVVNKSSGRCWSSELYNPVPGVMPNVPAARDYKGGFGTRLMAKDLRIALDAATSVHTTLPVTQAVSSMYTALEEKGYGDLDFSCVYMYNK